MIPGWHYNWNTEEQYYMNELESLKCFYKQLLTGDSTDDILGLFGIGKNSKYVEAIDTCESEEQMREHVMQMYKKYFGDYWHLFFDENVILLWIRRKPAEIKAI